MNKQTSFVFNTLISNNVKSVLNVGMRFNSDITLLNACGNAGMEFEVIEIFEPNCNSIVNFPFIKKIYCGDIKNVKKIGKNFDAIIWLHGPEHVPWADFLKMRKDIEDCANKVVIYQAPEGEYTQGEMYGNIYESHVASLNEKMFADLGYQTNNFLSDGENTFSAYVIRP